MVEVLIVIIILFIFAVFNVISTKVQTDLNNDIQADTDLSADAKTLHQDLTTRTPKVLDGAILFFFIFFWALSLASAYFQDVHPLFLIFSIILLLLVLFVIIAIGNSAYDVFHDADLNQQSVYPNTYFIFNNILEFGIAIGGTLLIAMFARPRSS